MPNGTDRRPTAPQVQGCPGPRVKTKLHRQRQIATCWNTNSPTGLLFVTESSGRGLREFRHIKLHLKHSPPLNACKRMLPRDHFI